MNVIRNIQLPNRPLSDRELKKLREAVESGDLEVDTAFSRLLESYLVGVADSTHGEITVRAASYFTDEFTTAVTVGVSFVPMSPASHELVEASLRGQLKTAGLTQLVRRLQLNDVQVDIT